MYRNNDGQSKGMGLVTYEVDRDAEEAVANLNEMQFQDSVVKVRWPTPKEAKSSR